MRILAILLFALTAAAEPFAVSPPSELGSAPGTRRDIALASNGERSLAVWQDGRGRWAVHGLFIDFDGRPHSNRDFFVSNQISYLADADYDLAELPHHAIASDGSDFLVAHSQSDQRGSWTSFTRVTGAGEVVPVENTIDGIVRSMVFAGGHYYLALVPDQSTRAWRATIAVVDTRGRVVRKGINPVHGDDDVARDLVLSAASTGEVLLAWQPWNQESVGVGVAKPGELLDPAFAGVRKAASFERMRLDRITLADGSAGFQLAGLASADQRLVVLAFLGRDGAVHHRAEVRNNAAITKLAAARYGDDVLVIANSVAFDDHLMAGSLRVGADGTPRDAAFERFDYLRPDSMAIVRGPASFLHWASIAFDIVYVAPVTGRVAGIGYSSARSYPQQDSSAVERCGDTNIVAWRDTWTYDSILRVRRFSADGVPLDPPNRALSGSTFASYRGAGLSIVCGRTNALLTWREQINPGRPGETQHGAILRADGKLLPLGELGAGEYSAAAWDGSSFVVLTARQHDSAKWLRWSEQGALLDAKEMSELAGRFVTDLELAWNGSSLMVAWTEDAFESASHRLDTRLRAREFSRRLQPNAPEMHIAPDLPIDWPQSLVLGARPGQWLAAWFEYRNTPDTRLRVSQLNGTPHLVAMDHVVPLRLSWNGSAWELLTEHGVATLDANGSFVAYRRLPIGEKVDAMATSGERRMYTFPRDFAGEPSRIYADFIGDDQLGPQRRRTARH